MTIMLMSREAMPSANGVPIDSVDSGFGLTTPRGYSGAKEVFFIICIIIAIIIFIIIVIIIIIVVIIIIIVVIIIIITKKITALNIDCKVFNKQLGIYQRPVSAHGVRQKDKNIKKKKKTIF